jgi:hypothetical protein
LYQEVFDDDKYSISNSNWYDLSISAYKEWKRFMRSVWHRGKKNMKNKCSFCGKDFYDPYLAEITIIKKIDSYGTYTEFRTGEEKVICYHCGGIKIELPNDKEAKREKS